MTFCSAADDDDDDDDESPTTTTNIVLSKDGNDIIATKGLRPPIPWTVLVSKKYPGLISVPLYKHDVIIIFMEARLYASTTTTDSCCIHSSSDPAVIPS
jgi:hypothetical protein